jgi:hypothetical protein
MPTTAAGSRKLRLATAHRTVRQDSPILADLFLH